MPKKPLLTAIFALLSTIFSLAAEPIVLNGAMAPDLLGAKVACIRLFNSKGETIPFQIDEVTRGGEYVCPQGESPNADSANGILDKQDEIVFLFEDADSGMVSVEDGSGVTLKQRQSLIKIRSGTEIRTVKIVEDCSLPGSSAHYLEYDHDEQFLRTPFYYARFGKDRFHFTRAGCRDYATSSFVDLTNELRVDILFKALWGLLPIRYSEDNIICKVRRYKAGPVRLIRRGDFYLKLGLGIRGSRAIVYQLCYPQLVKVPVRVYLPVRFSLFFNEAYIEMTPVIRENAKGFRFEISGTGFKGELTGKGTIDTLILTAPKKGYRVTDGAKGFEWITAVSVDDTQLEGSGYVLRRPSSRRGAAECGFRLTVNDLPKGSYDIVNWVFFPGHSMMSAGQGLKTLNSPATIITASTTFTNLLATSPANK